MFKFLSSPVAIAISVATPLCAKAEPALVDPAATVPQVKPWEMVSRPGVNLAPTYRWALYDLATDFNQTRDLALKFAKRLAALKQVFDEQAERYHVNPVNDRTDPVRSNNAAKALGQSPDLYEYWGSASIPLDAAPPITGRGFTISARLAAGEGTIAALGSRLGGWSFAIENGRPAVHHSLTPMSEDFFTLLSSSALVPGQKAEVGFAFDYDGGGYGKGGTVRITIDGKQVASARLDRSISYPDPHTESFDIGLDSGVPVVEAPLGSSSFKGKVEKVTVVVGPAGQKWAHSSGATAGASND